ncbi:uncharacterized protein Z518_09909 [Rhinocladiella mackenziei CBS 650.93]|uniref:Histidine kinase n=1 Tax=Rhinocladiella mackenziei CBS 650.93 TaxID=1442369 RepID=A0A0D2I4V9_9EURO|nr:uncharacterized protein Z518_09909 [Rhinocladiella mackenziei CBS 650.93]KIX00844.1 hypothetical protein Z518_09909 [Rhinocladiella mackenziei CBS 650.93]
MPGQDLTEPVFRRLEPHWDRGLIAASIAVSLLGAFTSTQMMCQARTSRYLSGVLVWTILGSLTFGFCSIWSLHFIAMLACGLDLRIGLDVPLTILSAVLAVSFTFAALISDLLRHRYLRLVKKKKLRSKQEAKEARRQAAGNYSLPDQDDHGSMDVLLGPETLEERDHITLPENTNGTRRDRHYRRIGRHDSVTLGPLEDHFVPRDVSAARGESGTRSSFARSESVTEDDSFSDTESFPRNSNDGDGSRRSSAQLNSDGSSMGLPGFMSFRFPKTTTSTATNAITGIAELLYSGAHIRNFAKGWVWSLAISTMHYVGIVALKIPEGHFTLQPFIVLVSALISWLVCTLGCILIPQIEVNLAQQLLFSVVAAGGVAGMHFTGMWATTFWSRADPTQDRGYPPNLAVAVTSIAIVTCILANGLLAHSATVARNKLAEIVQTKRKLWAAIAQKENAEAAAAARSEFIASASHEIRTPLHQLQGYSDLLSRTQLNDESRLLLLAIQQATRSLSMITANVLDWSRLEKGEAVCRPTSLDLRKVCESIVNILPSRDDQVTTELMIVVAPQVPASLFIDETYLQRILMNLLTNAMKFTQSGYVILLVEFRDQALSITVKDSGFGIPESFLPHLFEPFKQAQTRGAERGTGLGLAIIRQLLQKMQGTISVESKCQQKADVGPENCGSTFTVTIPVSTSTDAAPTLGSLGPNRRIAVFQTCNSRFLEGLQMAWNAFGFQVILADPTGEISDAWEYIWTDLLFLKAHPTLLRRLLQLQDQVVLVTCDSQVLLEKAFGTIPLPHIIPIRRPFLWHRMVDSIVSAAESGKSAVDRSVRFAPVVDFLDNSEQSPVEETPVPSGSTVLLVEDNKINQRLGVKMLETLGYNVVVADDGQDAIDKIVQYGQGIDLVLMDQSMPRKDGIMATKQIREMELLAPLSRRLPIIMVTAVVGPEAQALCMAAGTDAFLPKPLALSKLEHTLKKFLGQD